MRKEKVKINYSQLRDRELATLGGRVVRAMLAPQTAFAFFYSDLRSQVITLAACVEDYTQKHSFKNQIANISAQDSIFSFDGFRNIRLRRVHFFRDTS